MESGDQRTANNPYYIITGDGQKHHRILEEPSMSATNGGQLNWRQKHSLPPPPPSLGSRELLVYLRPSPASSPSSSIPTVMSDEESEIAFGNNGQKNQPLHLATSEIRAGPEMVNRSGSRVLRYRPPPRFCLTYPP